MWSVSADDWALSVRANLGLWPTVTDHVRLLFTCVGQTWDEEAFARVLTTGDTRAVRQTFEVLARVGFMYRDDGSDELCLTPMGDSACRFLGLSGGVTFANESNLHLLASSVSRAVAQVIEYQAIWRVMRGCDDFLTNEELNRVMARVFDEQDIVPTVEAVRDARNAEDPTVIGPRIYNDHEYQSAPAEQRRAITPVFQRLSVGGLLMSLGNERRFHASIVPAIDAALSSIEPHLHASTASSTVLAISSGY